MKISSKTWKSYIERLSRIDQKAAKSFADWFREHPDAEIENLLNYAYYTSDYYGNAASELACEMYDEVAVASGKTLPPAEPARTATYGEVAKAIQGKLLTTQDPDAVGAVVGNKVKTVGLDTLLNNSLRDGAQFAWIPSGDTCPFCMMLASNGWQRASKKALKSGHASHVHNNCDCTYAIRFDDETEVEGYDPDYYKDLYDSAEGDSWNDKNNFIRRKQRAANPEKYREQNNTNYLSRKIRELFDTVPESSVVEKLRSEFKPWIDSLSNKEVHALKKYTKNSFENGPEPFYKRLNKMLRGDMSPDPMLEEYANTISTALKRGTLSSKVAAYRGLNINAFPEISPGSIVPSKQFMSASVIPTKAFKGKYKIIIIAPPGAPCAYIEQLSGYPSQREILFDKDCYYRVLYNKNEHTVLEVIV